MLMDGQCCRNGQQSQPRIADENQWKKIRGFTRAPKSKGSAPAPGAVFRALAENRGAHEKVPAGI